MLVGLENNRYLRTQLVNQVVEGITRSFEFSGGLCFTARL